MIETRVTIDVYKQTGKYYLSYSYVSAFETHQDVLINAEARAKYNLNGYAYTITAQKGDNISKRIYF